MPGWKPPKQPPPEQRPGRKPPGQRPGRKPPGQRPGRKPPGQRPPKRRGPDQRPPKQKRPDQRPPEQKRADQRPPGRKVGGWGPPGREVPPCRDPGRKPLSDPGPASGRGPCCSPWSFLLACSASDMLAEPDRRGGRRNGPGRDHPLPGVALRPGCRGPTGSRSPGCGPAGCEASPHHTRPVTAGGSAAHHRGSGAVNGGLPCREARTRECPDHACGTSRVPRPEVTPRNALPGSDRTLFRTSVLTTSETNTRLRQNRNLQSATPPTFSNR
ncbi:Collagen alpha-5(VI) chain [Actinoplanes sp. SE50]|nr:Collagen alpha-5(VI) chain [Actinoplanes sp. SE50/110]ATO81029.1 Collagen alpha-5(VI) chain [Actinoplanes sp. SE50]SLL98436.1 hypothetical protein ACSP50_1662 [Actinoplanes sp. SE50/110]